MSNNQPEEPETILIEDILTQDDHPILKQYQVRDPYEEEDYARLTENIRQEGMEHGRPFYLTKLIRVFPLKARPGKYALYSGNARLRVLKVLGVRELVVGVDVVIDYAIDSEEKLLLKVIHENDLQKPLGWRGAAKSAKLLRDKFGWTQERIGKELGKDQRTISIYLRIVDTLEETIDDPVIEEIGLNRTLDLCKIWGQKQWVRPREGKDDGKPRNERGLVEIDAGKEMLEREREQTSGLWSRLPSELAIHDIITKVASGIPLPAALGSKAYTNSFPQRMQRTERQLEGIRTEARKLGYTLPPTLALPTSPKDRDEPNPNLRIRVKLIGEAIDSIIREIDSWPKRTFSDGEVEVTRGQLKGYLWRLRNQVLGLVPEEESKEVLDIEKLRGIRTSGIKAPVV
ncbi:MAG TPA: hypothetical protein VGR53_06940 [Nitrososphaerales archaeon]|nr:hypothetical protein [Nitrososphaerales archaeon]